eukprot:SM000322S12509  [mRNA]  locus=s322:33883:35979:- [translate_table: standard]
MSLLHLGGGGGGGGGACANTLQGRHALADDRGYVCRREDADAATGCCPAAGPRFGCCGCNATLGCCLVYETCVACCLDPAHTAPDFALKAMRAKQPSAGTYQSVFEYCRGQCRHNSLSVVHENAYARPDHHCFRPLEIKADDAAANEDELVDVSVVVASQGQSCDLACLTVGRQCGLTRLAGLNKCSVMQKHFDCRGSCIQSLGNDQPAEVVAGAPRHQFPGACMLNSKEAYLSCQGFHPNTRRLCPCIVAES